MYLAAAGVGKIRLVDPDPVELTNLNRQLLHHQHDCDASRPKVLSAADKLRSMNPDTIIETVQERLTAENARRIMGRPDVALDCLDNYEARHALNGYCISERLTLVHAAVEGWRGQLTTIVPGRTCCISCLVPRPPRRDEAIPIIGAVAGAFGSLEAAEAVKVLLSIPGTLEGRLLLGDLKEQCWETLDVDRNPDCAACGKI